MIKEFIEYKELLKAASGEAEVLTHSLRELEQQVERLESACMSEVERSPVVKATKLVVSKSLIDKVETVLNYPSFTIPGVLSSRQRARFLLQTIDEHLSR
jgi:predicted nuclease with TOPRIM domain